MNLVGPRRRSSRRSARARSPPRPSSSASSASCAAARRSRSRRPSRAARGVGTGTRRSAGVYVEGLDDVMVHLAKCCSPVPGRPDHGLRDPGPRRLGAPHRLLERDRARERVAPPPRRGRVGRVEHNSFRVTLDVRAFDRARLLADVSSAMAESHLNIVAAHTVDVAGPRRQDDLRGRARRPVAPRERAHPAEARRRRLRRVPPAPGPRAGERGGGPRRRDGAAAQPEGHPRRAAARRRRAGRRSSRAFATLAERHGFGLAHTPMFEDARVFRRGIGEASEVVGKEMYEFEDRGGRHLALRPEGTAPIVRAFVQHRPPVPWRVWYVTPAFRYEQRPGGPVPPAPPARRRGARHRGPRRRRRGDRARPRLLRATSGSPAFALRLNSLGDRDLSPRVPRGAARVPRAVAAELCDEHRDDVARATRCASSTASASACRDGDRRDAPPLRDAALRAVRGALRPRAARASTRRGVALDRDDRLVRGLDYYTRTTFEFAGTVARVGERRDRRRRPLRPARRGARRPADAGHRLRQRDRAAPARLRRRGRLRRRRRSSPRSSSSTSPAARPPATSSSRCAARASAPSAPTTAAR